MSSRGDWRAEGDVLCVCLCVCVREGVCVCVLVSRGGGGGHTKIERKKSEREGAGKEIGEGKRGGKTEMETQTSAVWVP